MKYDMENNRQRSFFENGGTLSYESRKQALMALKTSVKKNEPDILAALKKDLGKSAVEAYMTEIGIFYSDISFDIKNLKKWMKPKKCGTPMTVSPAKSWILQSPYGVVLIISPWNYPFLLTFEPLAAALAAGNCCVVKPSLSNVRRRLFRLSRVNSFGLVQTMFRAAISFMLVLIYSANASI